MSSAASLNSPSRPDASAVRLRNPEEVIRARRRLLRLMSAAVIAIPLLALSLWYSLSFDALGQGRSAYAAGDYRGALRVAHDHLERRPSDRGAALLAARCLSRLGFQGPAEKHYRLAGGLVSRLDDMH